MTKAILEKIWILFASTIYIEWIIKHLIIFKNNDELIQEINEWTISKKLNEEREKIFKRSFNQEIVNEFSKLYSLNDSDEKLFTVILSLRDIFWHSRISVNEKMIWYTPSSKSRLEKIKNLFWIDWEWNTISINDESLDFINKKQAIEILDNEILPKYAKIIWLNYEKIR